jgi:predicted P-loop ATPase
MEDAAFFDNTIEDKKYNRPEALQILWDWLQSFYEFETDAIKEMVSYREAGHKEWVLIQDRHYNEIAVKATFAGVKGAEKKKIKMLLESHLVQRFNYIHDYFKSIRGNKFNDAIKKLCACITTSNNILFEKYMRKWFVGSVANVYITTDCTNHICPVLTGGQGLGKTRFINYICPNELKKYMYSSELDLNKKSETAWKLAEYWIINLEEQLKQYNRQHANSLKALITLTDIKGRKPYGVADALGIRIANFIASTNDDDFLSDKSGSRRFPSFRVLAIDEDAYKKININDVWAEAYKLFDSKNFTYWATTEDILELEANNKEYEFETIEEQIIKYYLTPTKTANEAEYCATNNDLVNFLTIASKNKTLGVNKIGAILKRLKFVKASQKMTKEKFATYKYFFNYNTTDCVDMLHEYKNPKATELVQNEIGF